MGIMDELLSIICILFHIPKAFIIAYTTACCGIPAVRSWKVSYLTFTYMFRNLLLILNYCLFITDIKNTEQLQIFCAAALHHKYPLMYKQYITVGICCQLLYTVLSRNIYLEYTQCCLKHTAAILLLKPYHHSDATGADIGFTDGNAEHFISYKPIDGKYPAIFPPAYKSHILVLQHRMSPLSI